MKGKQPLWPDTLWRRYGKPAVKAAEIKKRVAFHTSRHTYTTLLTQNGEDVKVVQELLPPCEQSGHTRFVRSGRNAGEAGSSNQTSATGTQQRRGTGLSGQIGP